MEIFKKFTFEAAHRLPNVPEGHKCARLHGHSYSVEVHITGEPDEELGWIMDFSDITAVVEPIIEQLDHYYLNEIDGLDNPTSENIARWLWTRISVVLPALSQLVISETCTSGCVYTGD
jgi:6-pyruvoyltetrahydropterin/6-carboxytetrahydropterin synthase